MWYGVFGALVGTVNVIVPETAPFVAPELYELAVVVL
jgi:hypothetical protein